MELFGFQIVRADKNKEKDRDEGLKSFVEVESEEAGINIPVSAGGGMQSLSINLDSAAKTETDLVNRYRAMSLQPEVERAIDDIVNEIVVIDEKENPVGIVTDELEYSDKFKEKIREEFENILHLLDFSFKGYDIVKKWYVDGRLNYHAVIDENNPHKGIQELRYIDPRKIRKVREYEAKTVHSGSQRHVRKTLKNEYYVFSDTGFGYDVNKQYDPNGIEGLKIAKDSIVHCNSGFTNDKNTVILSYLHKAYKPLNQLRIMEDATLIYRISRAPERRVFYIDTGRMPTQKAEQHLRNMMVRYKNKVSYNAATGELNDDKNVMTMTDDFWFARPEGSTGTTVDTLQAGENLGQMEDVLYFQKQLYKSLNVPLSRLDEGAGGFSLGRSSEITRDELHFAKFIKKLRIRFSILFNILLERQLVLKNIIRPEEWKDLRNKIRYDFKKDNYFEEFKQAEILSERLNLLERIDNYTGKFFSKLYVQKNVLMMTEEEIEEENKQMEKELDSGEIVDPQDVNQRWNN